MLQPTLLVNITLVTNNKINYFDLFLAVSLSVLLGVGLWVLGLDLWRGQGRGRKTGGVLVLLLALGYSLGWLGLSLWTFLQLRDYL